MPTRFELLLDTVADQDMAAICYRRADELRAVGHERAASWQEIAASYARTASNRLAFVINNY